MLIKFAQLHANDGTPAAFDYGNRWYREVTPRCHRLVIGPSTGHVELIEALCQPSPGPFGILYVLLTPRRDHEPGRYQCPTPVNHAELGQFLRTYQSYLEQDGRHHLWVMCLATQAQFVYDHHNVIFAYGPLDTITTSLGAHGFRMERFGGPDPHQHCYHAEFDNAEDQIMAHWAWKQFPLQGQDGC